MRSPEDMAAEARRDADARERRDHTAMENTMKKTTKTLTATLTIGEPYCECCEAHDDSCVDTDCAGCDCNCEPGDGCDCFPFGMPA